MKLFIIVACILVFISSGEKLVKAQDNNNEDFQRNLYPNVDSNVPYRGLLDEYLRYGGVRHPFDKGYGYPADNSGNRIPDDYRNFRENRDDYRIPGSFGDFRNPPNEFHRENWPYGDTRENFGNYGRYDDRRQGYRPDSYYRGRNENLLDYVNYRPPNFDDYRRDNPFRDYYDPYGRYGNERFQPYDRPFNEFRDHFPGDRNGPNIVGNRFLENGNNPGYGDENQGGPDGILETNAHGGNNTNRSSEGLGRWENDGSITYDPNKPPNNGFRRWYPNFNDYDQPSFPIPYDERREPFGNNERIPGDANNDFGSQEEFNEPAPNGNVEISNSENIEENK